MSGPYYRGMCFPELAAMHPGRAWALVAKNVTVPDEAALLALTAEEINVGDDVIILAATTHTLANGVVKVVDTTKVGTWLAFVVIGGANDAAEQSSEMGCVVHGADNTVARPTGFPAVTWIGSVEPLNMIDGDIWEETV